MNRLVFSSCCNEPATSNPDQVVCGGCKISESALLRASSSPSENFGNGEANVRLWETGVESKDLWGCSWLFRPSPPSMKHWQITNLSISVLQRIPTNSTKESLSGRQRGYIFDYCGSNSFDGNGKSVRTTNDASSVSEIPPHEITSLVPALAQHFRRH